MKKFIIHTLIFCTALLGVYFYILLQADGYSGAFYMKISSPKQSNLILGTSKAAQGIQPSVLKEELQSNFYNYAFSIHTSPYGKTYLNSIKNKLDKQKRNNTFILTVDAWSICSATKSPNDSLNFRENETFLSEIKNVTIRPNLKYLIKYYNGKYYKLLSNKSPAYLHDNGWLEVSLHEDEINRNRRTKFTLNEYREKAKNYKFSNIRFSYLLKTIDYLNEYGKVYLVRLPVHNDLMKIEDSVVVNFNQIIFSAISKSEKYIDLSEYNSKLQFTDGVHLSKESGERITKIIAQELNSSKKW